MAENGDNILLKLIEVILMSDRFSRTTLLLGQENIDKLKSSRVAIFGVGGVGGHCAEALCRTGIGMIGLFDGDIIDISNINRQITATQKTIGLDKVGVMRERLLEINPEAIVEAHKLFYLPETANNVDLSVYDYIIDAVDTIIAKLEIICRAAALSIPVISAMGAANKLDPTAFEVADIYETSVCPIARIMRGELRKRGVRSLKVVYSKERPLKPAAPLISSHLQGSGTSLANGPNRRQPPASVAYVPPVAGYIIAAETVKDLLS